MYTNKMASPDKHKTIFDLGKLGQLFGQTYRVTLNEDGKTFESDTDHTVTLALVAIFLANKYYQGAENRLNIGHVNNLCLIHDLVEAYAGDTDSFMADFNEGSTAKQDKKIREHEAFLRLESEFKNEFPWLIEHIHEYENLTSREARFVKTVDKITPKITHILNGGQYIKNNDVDIDKWLETCKKQAVVIRSTYGAEFPEMVDIFEDLLEQTKRVYLETI